MKLIDQPTPPAEEKKDMPNSRRLDGPADYARLVAAVEQFPSHIKYEIGEDGICVHGRAEDVVAELAKTPGVVNSIITDPPWMLPAIAYPNDMIGGAKAGRLWSDVGIMRMAFKPLFEGMRQMQVDGGASAVFCGEISNALFTEILFENWNCLRLTPWEKNGGRIKMPLRYGLEYVILLLPSGSCYGGEGQKTEKPILRFNMVQSKGRIHPAEKPVDLLEYLIRLLSPKGGIVADLFAGSFSLMRAARNTGRKYFCVEADLEFAKRAAEKAKREGVRKGFL